MGEKRAIKTIVKSGGILGTVRQNSNPAIINQHANIHMLESTVTTTGTVAATTATVDIDEPGNQSKSLVFSPHEYSYRIICITGICPCTVTVFMYTSIMPTVTVLYVY